MISLILSIIALVVSLLVAYMVFKLKTTLHVNLYNFSKNMNVLLENQNKIIELTKIKGFVELTNEELEVVHKEIVEERTKVPNKVPGVVRPPDGDKIDKKP